jgi:riboflavin kinase/FMN adenylyltransferase
MKIARGLYAPLPPMSRPVVTLGGFDAVHRGHQAVLAETTTWAADLHGEAVVLTFDPLPKAVIGPGEAHCITSLDHRLLLLERCGVDVTAVLDFDQELAAMPAETFVHRVLLGWIATGHVVLGFDSTFGRRGKGNAELLRRFQAQGLLEVRTPEPVCHDGAPISSTLIREAIAEGRLHDAAQMLGRRVTILGTVVPGDRRGRSLGFPTANLDLHHEVAPPAGVYATVACLDGQRHPALTYIGPRPTFHPQATEPAFEVHLLGFQGDLYGRRLEVEFLAVLRGDQRFPSSQALVAQMEADRQAAEDYFRRHPEATEPAAPPSTEKDSDE